MSGMMTNRKRNDSSNTRADGKVTGSPPPNSLGSTNEESDSHDSDVCEPLIHNTYMRTSKRRSKKNDWTIPFDLRDLTSPSARNEILTTASKFAGTRSSRSGRYIRPSWKDILQNYIPSQRMCLFFVCIFVVVVVSGFRVVSMMNRGEYYFQGVTLEVEDWCLFVDNNECECTYPLEPQGKNDVWWNQAMELNLRLVNNVTSNLDIVLLGDSIMEQWNGRKFGEHKDDLNDTRDMFNSLFRKDHEGMLDGIALGIAGDTASNLLYRIRNGEIPTSLNPKVWWLLIGTNDLELMQCSEEVISLKIEDVAKEILQEKPNSKVVINGILPRTNRKDGYLTPPLDEKNSSGQYKGTSQFDFWPSIQMINDGLKDFSKTFDNVEYVDSSEIFTVQLGNKNFIRNDKQLITDLMGDFLHPTSLGCKHWGESIVNYTLSLTNSSFNLNKI